MKKGFTLAEVLVTLAIIGIVAALTIPTVVHKYQQKAYYTQFMKAYNMLSTAFYLGLGENGNPSTSLSGDEFFQNYFVKYLKVAASCKNNADACVSASTPVKNLNGTDLGASIHDMVNDMPSVLLQDGTLVMYDNEDGNFFVDTNGSKGPNTMGRDIFMFQVKELNNTEKGQTEYKFAPFLLYIYYDLMLTLDQAIDITKLDEGMEESKRISCSNEPYAEGHLCATRLLLEGKMNY